GTADSTIEGDTITTTGLFYTLGWSDPLGASSNDYDLFIMDSTLSTVIGSSTNIQDGSQDPFESIPEFNFATGQVIDVGEKLVVFKSGGAAVRAISLNTIRGVLSVATTGQIHGHTAAANAFSVAATPAFRSFGASFPSGPFPNS